MNPQENTLPSAPEALDGWATLHEFYRMNWSAWKKLSTQEQQKISNEAVEVFSRLQKPEKGHSGCFAMIGHKADLMFLHFRPKMEDLTQVELDLKRTALFDYLIPTTSYVSIVELGMYEMTLKIHEELTEKGLKQDSDEWKAAWKERIDDQYSRMGGRIWCEIPPNRYVCFYPMNKKRADKNNWYDVPFNERQMMMREHGMIGRKYAGQITQVISGSIGTDDWEWGVDLFADNPNVFKKLVYEMRFDKASALYGEFGPFYIGMQFNCKDLGQFLSGTLPSK
ncbi:MAG: heme-dependent peroxidase [Proteobacteria bacterium]|jgi:peroxiredoxin|nr:heme-dependent peroxidase [Pseudomonadota bacterium]